MASCFAATRAIDGSFSLASVVPGDDTILAIEHRWDLDGSQPGISAHYLDHRRKISVNAGAQGQSACSKRWKCKCGKRELVTLPEKFSGLYGGSAGNCRHYSKIEIVEE